MPESTDVHTIAVRPPFDLALTVAVLRRLPANMLYRTEHGELRLIASRDDELLLLGVRQSSPGEVAYRILDATLTESRQAPVEGLVRRLLGLDRDMAPLAALVEGDSTLGPLVQRLAGMRPPRFLSLWETLIQVIPFQQVSLAAAMSAVNRLAAALGPRVEFEGQRYLGLPSLDRALKATDEEYRACGLSMAKARALRGCAEWIHDGAIKEDELAGMPDEEAALRLRALPGIGPWSAQLILLRGFGRLGNFPAGDSGAIRGLRDLYKSAADPDDAAATALARMGEWRGYLYFMLLARRQTEFE